MYFNGQDLHYCIYLVLDSVDMLLGMDGLSARVQPQMQTNPCEGHIFVFKNIRANRIKVLKWDATGVWLAQHRLIVLFDYQPDRRSEHTQQFLENFSGHLMVDDYAGYKKLFKENPNIIELGCMVHARRKFFDFYHATQSPIAKTALDFFACLYQIEGQAKEVSVQERTEIRQKHGVPVLEKMKQWLDEQALVVKSAKLLNAISYTLKRLASLIRYAQDGSLPIDNNPVENHIRPIAIGKKNWLFVGCPKAGQSMSAIYSLLMTAKRNGLEPYAWLKNVLERLPTQKNKDIAELLPFKTFQFTNTNED